jgi:hypothetical protein
MFGIGNAVLKGRGGVPSGSRATKGNQGSPALAAGGMRAVENAFPQGLL